MTLFTGLNVNSVADAPGGVLAGFFQFLGLPSLAQLQDGFGDTINGNGGNDRIFAGNANDIINGGDDNDVISGMFGLDTMDGGAGIDTHDVTFFAGNYIWNMVTGVTNFAGETAINFENARMGAGNDQITGTGGTNTIDGGAGSDILRGEGGNDRLFGNFGNDTLVGGTGIDLLDGGAGNDLLLGGTSVDNLFGGDGNDTARVLDGEFADNFNGGLGADFLDLSAVVTFNRFANVNLLAGTYSLNGFGPAVNVTQVERVAGTQLSDIMTGDNFANTLLGRNGNDSMSGLDGNDFLAGENGNDILNGGNGNDFIDGGNGNDVMFGVGGSDTMQGGAGFDTVNGGDGNDVVNGGLNNDTLTGGLGFDTFQFNTPLAGNLDFITDFVSFFDTIQLENAVFAALPAGPLAAAAFRLGPAAVDLDDRIMYDAGTGFISYDPTGIVFGAADQVTFARVVPGTFVSFTDFAVV